LSYLHLQLTFEAEKGSRSTANAATDTIALVGESFGIIIHGSDLIGIQIDIVSKINSVDVGIS